MTQRHWSVRPEESVSAGSRDIPSNNAKSSRRHSDCAGIFSFLFPLLVPPLSSPRSSPLSPPLPSRVPLPLSFFAFFNFFLPPLPLFFHSRPVRSVRFRVPGRGAAARPGESRLAGADESHRLLLAFSTGRFPVLFSFVLVSYRFARPFSALGSGAEYRRYGVLPCIAWLHCLPAYVQLYCGRF